MQASEKPTKTLIGTGAAQLTEERDIAYFPTYGEKINSLPKLKTPAAHVFPV